MKPTQYCTAQVIDLNYFRSIKEITFLKPTQDCTAQVIDLNYAKHPRPIHPWPKRPTFILYS